MIKTDQIIALIQSHVNHDDEQFKTIVLQMSAAEAAKVAQDHGVVEIDVIVKGPGPGRESAIRSLQAAGLQVNVIGDATPIPHNGCRPPKRRRYFFY